MIRGWGGGGSFIHIFRDVRGYASAAIAARAWFAAFKFGAPSGSLRSNEPARIDMTHLHQIETDRAEHPLDVVERLAALRDWIFDRAETDEMSVSVSGRWTDYHIAFTWIEDVEAVHVACAFDLKVPDRRRAEVLQLIGLV